MAVYYFSPIVPHTIWLNRFWLKPYGLQKKRSLSPSDHNSSAEVGLSFDDTATVEALRAAYTQQTGKAAVYAMVPDVALHSPKMKSGRSTRWFTDNVMIRYNDCLGRSGRK